MQKLLLGLAVSALFSLLSLAIILLRVSPITSPEQALPAFFISFFLSCSTVGSLCAALGWHWLPHVSWDGGKLLTVSIREGLMLGIVGILWVVFFLFGLLTWWIAAMIALVFVLVETALLQN